MEVVWSESLEQAVVSFEERALVEQRKLLQNNRARHRSRTQVRKKPARHTSSNATRMGFLKPGKPTALAVGGRHPH